MRRSLFWRKVKCQSAKKISSRKSKELVQSKFCQHKCLKLAVQNPFLLQLIISKFFRYFPVFIG